MKQMSDDQNQFAAPALLSAALTSSVMAVIAIALTLYFFSWRGLIGLCASLTIALIGLALFCVMLWGRK